MNKRLFDKKTFYTNPIEDPTEKTQGPTEKTHEEYLAEFRGEGMEPHNSFAMITNTSISDLIDKVINEAIPKYKDSIGMGVDPFEILISMGELVDRLSIVNFKLYKLKDDVMDRQDDETFKAWASVEDVKLVMERARLKKCIDQKLVKMIQRVSHGDDNGGFNPEVKKYGK